MKILKPTAIILLAATIVVLVSLPLAQTEWADGLRESFVSRVGETEQSVSREESSEVAQNSSSEEGEGPPAAMRLVGPFVKELLFIGIPGTLLVVILRVTKHLLRQRKHA